MEDKRLITDDETIRAIVLHTIRTGDTSRAKYCDPRFTFKFLYPEKPRPADVKVECTNCDHGRTFDIGYGNYQCDVCQYVVKTSGEAEHNEMEIPEHLEKHFINITETIRDLLEKRKAMKTILNSRYGNSPDGIVSNFK
jgi:ribosomal protein S27E